MTAFHGFVFSKLHLIGTRSEGPKYVLQQFDYSELAILKQTDLWQEDPKLQKELGKKVTLEGKLTEAGLIYDHFSPYVPEKLPLGNVQQLEVDLILEANPICLDRVPTKSLLRPYKITLTVRWPYRSIWRGQCPTSQLYDIFVEYEGNSLWQWSKNRFFLQVQTPVSIQGGSPYAFAETWVIDPATIQTEGTYTIRAVFIASGQEVTKDVVIKFAN